MRPVEHAEQLGHGQLLGTRAQGVLLRTLLGSVGQEVAEAAACDVLLVPAGTAITGKAA